MKKQIIFALGLGLFVLSACSGSGRYAHNDPAKEKKPEKETMRLTLLPQDTFIVGKPTVVMAKLTSLPDQFIITDADLETVHTQKLHLLVVDPTLTDYQHIHPQPTSTPGLYSFLFTPHMAGGYRAWADVTPVATHEQAFVAADLGNPKGGGISKTESHEATAGEYRFVLSFDKPPAVDNASMGTIAVTDAKGKPVTSLEPVMGAFGHIVGFYDDFRTVVHVHPMGKEPASASERGGPELMFHLEPGKAGFIKLFAQVKINGKELFVPFGVNVTPKS